MQPLELLIGVPLNFVPLFPSFFFFIWSRVAGLIVYCILAVLICNTLLPFYKLGP